MTPLSQFLPDSLKAKIWTLRTLQVENGTQKPSFRPKTTPDWASKSHIYEKYYHGESFLKVYFTKKPQNITKW